MTVSPETILVTGAGGLLGRRLVKKLSEEKRDTRIIATTRNLFSSFDGLHNVKLVSGDLREMEFWRSLPNDITHIVHLSAVIPWGKKEKYNISLFGDNLAPMVNMIERSKSLPALKKIVYGSSVSVYNPDSYYSYAKLAGEKLLQKVAPKRIGVTSLRFSSIYGAGQNQSSVLPLMIKNAVSKGEITVFGQGRREQNFLYHDDGAGAIINAIQSDSNGEYDIGSATCTTMIELAETINKVFCEGRAKIIYKKEMPEDAGLAVDISSAQRDLNYTPKISLEAGLKLYKKEMSAGLTSAKH